MARDLCPLLHVIVNWWILWWPKTEFWSFPWCKTCKNITYGGDGSIYLLSLLVGQKVVVTKHLTTQCYTLVCAAVLMEKDLYPLLYVLVIWWILWWPKAEFWSFSLCKTCNDITYGGEGGINLLFVLVDQKVVLS